MGITLSNGFQGGFPAKDMTMLFSLNAPSIYIGGVSSFTPTMPNVSEFTNLFEFYRIRKVNLTIWSTSIDSTTTSANNALPVIHIVNDKNSSGTGAFALSDIEQMQGMRTYQLGIKPIKWSCVPYAKQDVLTNNLVTSSSASAVAAPWIDCAVNNIEFYGIKIYLNTMGRNSAIDVGSVMFQIEYEMDFKFVK